MKTISILTATRAEYGLLKPLIRRFVDDQDFQTKIVVTGSHLSPEFGLTYQEIEKDGFEIDRKIEILLSADTPMAISKTMGLAMISFADYFEEIQPDLLILLGDRYEALAVATVALNHRIPIAHLHGGETTEGAIDESIRHAITKLSYLHFTSTEDYRRRVMQLGEDPNRVFNVGSLGVENILKEKLLSKEEITNYLGISSTVPYILLTFHPVTLENYTAEEQVESLLRVCIDNKEINFIFTKANADTGGRRINKLLDDYAKKHENIFAYTSLGLTRYLSAMKYSECVVGNSSSGILETPTFGIPTINIGDRQKGRIQAPSVINAKPTIKSIEVALQLALSKEFKSKAKYVENPYEKIDTSKSIHKIIKDFIQYDKIDLKKTFYDIKL